MKLSGRPIGMTPKPSSFTGIAKDVFRERLSNSKWGKSEWTGKSNIAWAVVHLGEQFVGYFIVQRTYRARITGELAFSRGLHNPGLFGPIQQKKDPFGIRIRIGHLIGEGDLWWPCSQDASTLSTEIGQLVSLLIQHSDEFFLKSKTHAREQFDA